MKKNWLRGLLLGVSMALLLFPNLTYAQDEPPVKDAAQGEPSICGVAPQPEGGPDGYGYVWDVVNWSWTDISSTGTPVTADVGENDCELVNIGFSFSFYGSAHTQVNICADGYLTFEQPPDQTTGEVSDWNIDCADPPVGLLHTNGPNDAVYAFWTDLDPTVNGAVYYETLGTAPNRTFVVQFDQVGYWAQPDTYIATFEIILYEGSNDILVQFYDVPPTPYVSPFGTAIGIENNPGSDGLTYFCESGATAAGVPYDGLDILFRYNFDLGNQVWYDTNQNGIQDSGEPGVAAMTIDLFPTSDCTGPADANGITDGNGFYLFPDLTAGDYCLEFSNIPAGWVITPQDQGADGVDSDVDPKTRQITGIALVDEDDLDQDMGLYEPHVEFVPEPGSIMLLGTGLAGLAGYVTLRWRTRE